MLAPLAAWPPPWWLPQPPRPPVRGALPALLCSPRAPRGAPCAQVTDISFFLRIVLVVAASLCAITGFVGVLLFHLMAKQKAPVVIEAEPIELYREVKAVP